MTRCRALTVCLVLAASVTAAAAPPIYVPVRVVDARVGRVVDVEAVLADMARSDVTFIGEEHDDPNTHRVERVLVEGLARRAANVVLAMEMFERDVQEPLDHFQMGHIDEADFLRDARPWPRYATDYKPLVDAAVAAHWPVVAANVPRAVAADVAASGFSVLSSKYQDRRDWFAGDRHCDASGTDFRRFREAMRDHETPGAGAASAASTEHYFDAQCLKDETMAESIARAHTAAAFGADHPPVVVSVNGSFHSDYRGGLVAATARRMPGKRMLVIAIQPVTELDHVQPSGGDRKRADYVVYTIGEDPRANVATPTTPPGVVRSGDSSSSARSRGR